MINPKNTNNSPLPSGFFAAVKQRQDEAKAKRLFLSIEKNRGLGWTLYAVDPKTKGKTYAGSATSDDTLDYRISLACRKFNIHKDNVKMKK
jgi:uncharacterized protein (DUF2147 family)